MARTLIIDDDEQVAVALRERLAFHVLLDDYHPGEIDFAGWGPCQISKARDALPDITIGEPVIEQLCNAAAAFGIPSVRAELLSLRAARAAAFRSSARPTTTPSAS